MTGPKNNKNSGSPFKEILLDFFGSVADSYYKADNNGSTIESTTLKEKTALLDTLTSLFDTVRKVDDTVKDSVEKTIFNKVSIPVKAFARLRVEDFFYATVINNLLLNLQDRNNMEEYGYTEQAVKKIEKNWKDLVNKARLIIRKQMKAKIDERLITKNEYYSFSSSISNMSPGLKIFIKAFEERISLNKCLKFLEDKQREFLDENRRIIKEREHVIPIFNLKLGQF